MWTGKSSLGNLFCLNSLKILRFALLKISRSNSGGRVTELSSSSLSISPLLVTFSLTTINPPTKQNVNLFLLILTQEINIKLCFSK